MKDDLAGFLFETLIKSLEAKYKLACLDQFEANDLIKRMIDDPDNNIKPIYEDKYKELRSKNGCTVYEKIVEQNKLYSKEILDIRESIEEIILGIEKTCMPVQYIKQKLTDIIKPF